VCGLSFSYDGFPADNLKDEVRFLLGDTDSTDQLLSDEEIYYLLTYFPNPIASAAMGAERLATQYARDASNKAVGDLKINLTEKSKSFGTQASRLWILSKQYRGRPQCYAGGISKTDRQNQLNNSDRVPPDFYRHMNDLPGTGTELGSSFGSS
jgi:hypothetical protein